MKYTEKIYDASTGEETIFERDFTEEELAKIAVEEKRLKALEKEITARKTARNVLLEKLGITEEEARLLLG